ncbi:MAG TPA: glycosyltransferase [Leucothrix mucor]|nr:glycosyltransferase [Leucothrix mucor]
MIKIAHISTGLETGGAEVQLIRLLEKLDKNKFEMIVISLDKETYLADKIRNELKIPVHSLCLKKNPLNIRKAYFILKEFNPDIIHGTMYEGGVVGTLFNKFLPNKPPVIWTVHEGLEHYRTEIFRKQVQLRLWGLISNLPDCMMYVSHLNCEQHLNWGFKNRKALVVTNGVDTQIFKPNPSARKEIRKELGIPQDAFVIGITARFHPVKNHVGFLRAAAILHKLHPTVHFVMVGTDINDTNTALTNIIEQHKLQNNVHMLGNREDIPNIVNAYDIAALTSLGEAFPLTLGEAMASSVPCVASNVGDNEFIIKDTGRVVPANDDQALAVAWQELVEMDKDTLKHLGESALQRALDNFTLVKQVQAHETLYETLHQHNTEKRASLKHAEPSA